MRTALGMRLIELTKPSRCFSRIWPAILEPLINFYELRLYNSFCDSLNAVFLIEKSGFRSDSGLMSLADFFIGEA